MKKALVFCAISFVYWQGFGQTNRNWYLGVGPTFETTWSVAESITGDTDNFRTGITETPGLKFVAHGNYNRFGLEWYGMVKKNRTKMVINQPKPEDEAYYDNMKSSAYQSGVALETGVYAGANFKVGRHELYTGLGAGVAYTRFGSHGSSTWATPSLNFNQDTSLYIESAKFDENPLSFNSITPLASVMISFRQKLKNERLGMVYSIENKWGLTPTMNESFSYDISMGNPNTLTNYQATFTNIRFIHIAASILFTFDVGGKKKGLKES